MKKIISLFILVALSVGFINAESNPKLKRAMKKDQKWQEWVEKETAKITDPAEAEAFRWTLFEGNSPYSSAFEFVEDIPYSKYRIEDYEVVSIKTRDGITLDGWFFPVPDAKGTIIVLHGWSSDCSFGLYQSRFLLKEGYQLLIYNARFHSFSNNPKKYVGFIGNDVDDVGDVIGYLKTRSDVDPDKIGIIGFSYGAEKAILAGAAFPELKVVMFDGSPIFQSSPEDEVIYNIMKEKYGFDYSEERLNNLLQIANISPRPVLILHGEQDESVPVENAHILYEKAGEPKVIHTFPNSGHCLGMVQRDKDDYIEKVRAFLAEYFK